MSSGKKRGLGSSFPYIRKAIAIDANTDKYWANVCKAMVKGKQDPPIEVEMVAKFGGEVFWWKGRCLPARAGRVVEGSQRET